MPVSIDLNGPKGPNILGVDKSKMCRVTFNEITKDAVKKQFKIQDK